MSKTEVSIRVILKMSVIWGSCAAVALPIVKVLIDFAYEIWRNR